MKKQTIVNPWLTSQDLHELEEEINSFNSSKTKVAYQDIGNTLLEYGVPREKVLQLLKKAYLAAIKDMAVAT